jgi:hypothetical protein
MTYPEFYGSEYEGLKRTQSILVSIIDEMKNAGDPSEDL